MSPILHCTQISKLHWLKGTVVCILYQSNMGGTHTQRRTSVGWEANDTPTWAGHGRSQSMHGNGDLPLILSHHTSHLTQGCHKTFHCSSYSGKGSREQKCREQDAALNVLMPHLQTHIAKHGNFIYTVHTYRGREGTISVHSTLHRVKRQLYALGLGGVQSWRDGSISN